jgi:transcriptional repressor NrdR
MNCPVCNEKTKVIDSQAEEDSIRRRRVCLGCKYRFFTVEIDEDLYERAVKEPKEKEEQT